MPVFNFTIDDISPLIVYDGVWRDSSHTDAAWVDYFNGTFHATQQLNATATLSFHGSAVYLYGAFRINHNLYTTTLDGQSSSNDGQNSAGKFQQNMFAANGLNLGQVHQILLKNTFRSIAAPFVDLDFVVVTDGDGNANTQSSDTTIDDGDPSIQYSSGWNNIQQDGYFNLTAHRTNGVNNFARVSFHGSAVALYGGTAPDHGLFSVSLDGGSAQKFNGSAPVQRSQVLLFYTSGLSNDQHELTITNIDTSGNWLDIDSVVFSDWSGTSSPSSILPGTDSSSSTPPSTSSHISSSAQSSLLPNTGAQPASGSSISTFPGPEPVSSVVTSPAGTLASSSTGLPLPDGAADPSNHTSSTGPIIGGVIGGVAAIAIIAGIFLYWLRHRKAYFPESTVPPFKSSSYEEYREAQSRITPPLGIRSAPGPGFPIIPHSDMQYLPQSASIQGTAGYEASILAGLAMTPPTADFPRSATSFTDIQRMQSPPPTYSQVGVPSNTNDHIQPDPSMYW